MTQSSFTLFGRYQIHQIRENAPAPARNLGIAHLFHQIIEMGTDAPISIIPEGQPDAVPAPAPGAAEADGQWSVWGFINGSWFWLLIGAESLDDIAEALTDFMANRGGPMSEVRICPPGSALPRALA